MDQRRRRPSSSPCGSSGSRRRVGFRAAAGPATVTACTSRPTGPRRQHHIRRRGHQQGRAEHVRHHQHLGHPGGVLHEPDQALSRRSRRSVRRRGSSAGAAPSPPGSRPSWPPGVPGRRTSGPRAAGPGRGTRRSRRGVASSPPCRCTAAVTRVPATHSATSTQTVAQVSSCSGRGTDPDRRVIGLAQPDQHDDRDEQQDQGDQHVWRDGPPGQPRQHNDAAPDRLKQHTGRQRLQPAGPASGAAVWPARSTETCRARRPAPRRSACDCRTRWRGEKSRDRLC